MRVVRVVGGDQRRADAPGQLDQLGVGRALLGQAVILQLDEEVVLAEDVLEAGCLLGRAVDVAAEQRLEHVAAEAPGGGDDTLGVRRQQLPVEPRLVVVALEECPRRELDEVLVAPVVLGEQRQVVVELVPALGVTARVVGPAAAGGPLGPGVVRHVRLGADDRLDPVLLTLPVEVEDSVHVAVIGDPDRRLTVGHRFGDELVEASSPVEHRELGVNV